MTVKLHSVTFDCAKPLALARFWAAATGAAVPEYGEKEMKWLADLGITDIEDDPIVPIEVPDSSVRLLFIQVPEGKTAKNRVHLDVQAQTTLREEVTRLVGLGAEVVTEMNEELGVWTVMRDPEGNEFCVERSKAESAQ